MKTATLSVIILGLAFHSSVLAQSITGFGVGQYNVTTSDFTTTQSATTLHIQGVDNGSILVGDLGTSKLLSTTPSQLALTGTLVGTNPGTFFQILLLDSNANQLIYGGSWTSFSLGQSQMALLNFISVDSSFDGTVTTLGLNTGGSPIGTTPLDFTFEGLMEVPEPSVSLYILCGFVLCFGLMRKAHEHRRSC